MVALDNSNKTLLEGLVKLLRDEIGSEFSTNTEHSVPNIWGKQVPVSSEDEFPRGSVDVISGNDFELSVDLDVRLREVTVKIVVFGNGSGKVEALIEDIEGVLEEKWDQNDPNTNEPYIGDWSMRETDGFTELNESGEQEGDLIYSRSVDLIFETIRN